MLQSALVGTFHIKGPKLLSDLMAVSSVGDGFSLDFYPLQCITQLSFINKLYFYMAMPLLCIMVPALVMYLFYHHRVYVTKPIREAQNNASLRNAVSIDGPQRSSRGPQGQRGRGQGQTAAWTAESNRSNATGDNEDDAAADPDRDSTDYSEAGLWRQAKLTWRTSVTVLLFLIHNQITKILFTTFDYYEKLVYGNRILRADVMTHTAETGYIIGAVFAAIGVVIYTFGIPFLAMAKLSRNKHKLNSQKFFRVYGFLYDGAYRGQYIAAHSPTHAPLLKSCSACSRHAFYCPTGYSYRNGRYLWEGAVLLRKIGITIISVVIYDPFFQVSDRIHRYSDTTLSTNHGHI